MPPARLRSPRPSAPPSKPTPGALVAGVAAFAGICLAFAVTFQLFDTDLWMHLTRARAALSLGGIPDRQLWTWPLYGGPDVGNAAWGFAFLVWPFWKLGGVAGLFVWRWVTALGTFALAWRTARGIGARGLAAIVVVLACAMIYRPRSQVRPETLAALLLALEIWILERRRNGGRDFALLLIPLAWVWLAAHASFWTSWLVCGVFALEEWRTRSAGPKRRIPLVAIVVLMAATALWNPLAGRTLEMPAQFLALRSEPLYQGIGELKPIDWGINWQNGLPLLMAGWPLLQIRRWRKGRGDLVEALLCAAFTAWAMSAQRFLTFWAVAAAPYLARDVSEWLGERGGWVARVPPAARAVAAAALCATLAALEILRAGFPLGIGIRPESIPIAASDFIASAGVRGRAFNYFEHGGYLLWRFWPDRERLPFMTTAPELATPEIRLEYQRAMVFAEDWQRMDQRHRFDWVLLKRQVPPGDRYLDFLDRDPAFALVFLDDLFALYVRREGEMKDVVGRRGFRWLPATQTKLDELAPRLGADAAGRAELRADLERAIGSSAWHAKASMALASLDIAEGRWPEADRALEETRRIDPSLPGYEERRAAVDAALGRASGTRP